METSDRKIIISGDTLECYIYRHFYNYGPREQKTRQVALDTTNIPKENIKNLYETEEETIERKKRISIANKIRSRQSLVRLIDANKVQERHKHSFLTLTFKDDVRSIPKAQREFAKFIQRLNYLLYKQKEKEIKYVAVIEFQDKTRKGVIHFHVVLFNVPFIEFQKVSHTWGQGYVKINAIDRVKRIKNYMSKYIMKGFDDPRLFRKKKYFGSINLNRPQTVREPNHVDSFIEALPSPYLKKVSSYYSNYLGNTEVLIYEEIPVDLIRQLLEQRPPPRYLSNDDF